MRIFQNFLYSRLWCRSGSDRIQIHNTGLKRSLFLYSMPTMIAIDNTEVFALSGVQKTCMTCALVRRQTTASGALCDAALPDWMRFGVRRAACRPSTTSSLRAINKQNNSCFCGLFSIYFWINVFIFKHFYAGPKCHFACLVANKYNIYFVAT